jgi:hypothetical protein
MREIAAAVRREEGAVMRTEGTGRRRAENFIGPGRLLAGGDGQGIECLLLVLGEARPRRFDAAQHEAIDGVAVGAVGGSRARESAREKETRRRRGAAKARQGPSGPEATPGTQGEEGWAHGFLGRNQTG